MEAYDASIGPTDPEEWLVLEEQERLRLVQDYHRKTRAPVPHAARATHALVHVITENLLVGEDGPALRRSLERLISEGLDRHEAIHALGCVLLAEMNEALQGTIEFSAKKYLAEVNKLTAENWRRDYG